MGVVVSACPGAPIKQWERPAESLPPHNAEAGSDVTRRAPARWAVSAAARSARAGATAPAASPPSSSSSSSSSSSPSAPPAAAAAPPGPRPRPAALVGVGRGHGGRRGRGGRRRGPGGGGGGRGGGRGAPQPRLAAAGGPAAHRAHRGAAQEPRPVRQLPPGLPGGRGHQAGLPEPEAESGQFCVNTSGQARVESYNEQKPAAEWTSAERGSVWDAGSWRGPDHLSGGRPQAEPHLQAADRASHPRIPGSPEERGRASAPPRARWPGTPSIVAGRALNWTDPPASGASGGHDHTADSIAKGTG